MKSCKVKWNSSLAVEGESRGYFSSQKTNAFPNEFWICQRVGRLIFVLFGSTSHLSNGKKWISYVISFGFRVDIYCFFYWTSWLLDSNFLSIRDYYVLYGLHTFQFCFCFLKKWHSEILNRVIENSLYGIKKVVHFSGVGLPHSLKQMSCVSEFMSLWGKDCNSNVSWGRGEYKNGKGYLNLFQFGY